MENYTTKYFLSHDILGEAEVSKQDYIKAERAAGFYPKSGSLDDCATSAFGGIGLCGHTRTTKNVD
jgi:hypothetical protein